MSSDQKRRPAIRGFRNKPTPSADLADRSAFVNPTNSYLDNRYLQIEDATGIYAPLAGNCTFDGAVVFDSGAIVPSGISPSAKPNGYIAFLDDSLYYFAGGHRYKLTATLDDPSVGNTGMSIGMLLCLTYS